ncbi:MAG: PAS domain S-box protein, partial [Acidobacteria bacterium]|nr:PAS domain S-box protein [Acidobacteriota bacterium]
YTGEILNRRKDGSLFICHMKISALKNDQDNIIGYMASQRDISDLKLTEDKLRESEARYRAVSEMTSDYVAEILVDPDGTMKLNWVTEGFRKSLGYNINDLIGGDLKRFKFHTDNQEIYDDKIKNFVERKESEFEMNMMDANGEKRTLKIIANPKIDPETNKVTRIIIAAMDITDKKKVEDKLHFRSMLLDQIRDVIVATDLEGNITYSNKAESDIMEWNKTDLVGHSVIEFGDDPDEGATQQEIIDQTLKDETWSGEVVNYSRSGKKIYFNTRTWLIKNDDGEKIGMVGVSTDITDNKRTEQALKESEERYQTFIENFQGIAFGGEPPNKYDFFSGLVEEITGYTPEEITRENFNRHNIIHPDDFDVFKEGNRLLFDNPNYKLEREYRIISKNGKIKWLYEIAKNISDIKSHRQYIQGTIYDITEKKQLEAELLKTEKLESIGILAGGIAHDFNNILTGIMGNISLAQLFIKDDGKIRDVLRDAERATIRARDLANQLLTFSKGGAPIKKVVSLKEIIEDSIRLSLRGSNVKCQTEYNAQSLYVDVDPGQISQVFNNLLINADQAMPDGGTITINVDCTDITREDNLKLQNGKYLRIIILDEGYGIASDHLEKVFEPYFTTKQKGSGLGLATSYSIIHKHNGTIEVHSELGKGSSFTVYLPFADADVIEERKEEYQIIKGKGLVLVIDDEESVLSVAKLMLEKMGYNVITETTCESGIEAYKKSIQCDRPIDLIIMDLTIPGGMSGKEAIKKFQQINPDVKALVSSGYSNDPVLARYRDFGFIGYISKPYTIEDLMIALKKVNENKD